VVCGGVILIGKIIINDMDSLPVSWWKNVPNLKRRKKLIFKPGVNIVVGPNGTGKSTIIKLISRSFFAEQGGISMVTQPSLSDAFGFGEKSIKWSGYEITHDGGPVGHYDPDKTYGMAYGMFDDDFFSDGVRSLQLRSVSRGQKTLANLNFIIKKVADADGIEFGLKKDSVNSLWVNRLELIEKFLEKDKTLEPSQKTILLDEPERSLDLLNELSLVQWVQDMGKKYQLIIATHSPFLLFVPGVNIIETHRGYTKKIKNRIETIIKDDKGTQE